jgi:hypothetical protein
MVRPALPLDWAYLVGVQKIQNPKSQTNSKSQIPNKFKIPNLQTVGSWNGQRCGKETARVGPQFLPRLSVRGVGVSPLAQRISEGSVVSNLEFWNLFGIWNFEFAEKVEDAKKPVTHRAEGRLGQVGCWEA